MRNLLVVAQLAIEPSQKFQRKDVREARRNRVPNELVKGIPIHARIIKDEEVWEVLKSSRLVRG